MVAELIRLFGISDAAEAERLASIVAGRLVPFVEEFDGTPLVLIPGASARTEITLVLYWQDKRRTSTDQLKSWLPDFTRSNVATSLRNMEKDRQVHRNEDGAVLTALGRQVAEDLIAAQAECSG